MRNTALCWQSSHDNITFLWTALACFKPPDNFILKIVTDFSLFTHIIVSNPNFVSCFHASAFNIFSKYANLKKKKTFSKCYSVSELEAV